MSLVSECFVVSAWFVASSTLLRIPIPLIGPHPRCCLVPRDLTTVTATRTLPAQMGGTGAVEAVRSTAESGDPPRPTASTSTGELTPRSGQGPWVSLHLLNVGHPFADVTTNFSVTTLSCASSLPVMSLSLPRLLADRRVVSARPEWVSARTNILSFASSQLRRSYGQFGPGPIETGAPQGPPSVSGSYVSASQASTSYGHDRYAFFRCEFSLCRA